MIEPEIISPRPRRDYQRSWLGAYYEFLCSPHEHRLLKLMPLALLGVVPFSLLEDVLLPGIGFLESIPSWLLTIVILGITYNRVKRYK